MDLERSRGELWLRADAIVDWWHCAARLRPPPGPTTPHICCGGMRSKCCSASAATSAPMRCVCTICCSDGRGAVENGAKHVVQQRMKRVRMRWSELGARAILHVRCQT